MRWAQNPWVSASKLCARKRPECFPVRDNRVTVKRLDIGKHWRTDWQVYRHLMKTDSIVDRLHQLEREVRGTGASPLDPPLRILDVLLWMSTPEKGSVMLSDTKSRGEAMSSRRP